MTEKLSERILDFTERPVEVLTLPELKMSVNEVSTGGRNVHGMEHWQIFESIAEGLEKFNVGHSIGEILATDGGAKAFRGVNHIPMLEQQYGERALQATILRRIMGSIQFNEEGESETRGAIAISYHQEGIQMAYGGLVTICRNWTILRYQNIMSTFKTHNVNPMPLDKMIEVAIKWGAENGKRRVEELQTINRMKEIEIARSMVAEIIGEMTMLRIGRDKFRTEKVYPLSQTQINELTETYMSRMQNDPDKTISLWGFYNMITEKHRPGFTDLPAVIDNNVATSVFLKNKFGIN